MKHILVMDDNKISLAAAKKVLGNTYRVKAVTSGAQALKFLEKNSCEVILLDINMPEMDGFQTMKRIRAEIKNPPPVTFLTADNDEYTESCCLKAGAMDFITKPFSEPVMLSRVNRVIKLSEMKNELEAMLNERMQHIRHIQEMMEREFYISLRRADISTRYSGKQIIVILMDTNSENGAIVAQRIIDCFNKLYTGGRVHFEFGITSV